MPYLTPDSAPGDTICRTIVIPNQLDWITIVNGALSELFKAHNFEQYGSLTPQETADTFRDIWEAYHDSECAPLPIIGEVRWIAHNDVPSKWLFCQGQELVRADYPALYAAIGLNFSPGGTTTTFFLPDFRDRMPFGWPGSTSAPGTTGGEVLHTLSLTEIPTHHHDELSNTLGNFWQAGATAPARSTIGGATSNHNNTHMVTSDVGGNAPHNNMPPYVTMVAIIYTGVP